MSDRGGGIANDSDYMFGLGRQRVEEDPNVTRNGRQPHWVRQTGSLGGQTATRRPGLAVRRVKAGGLAAELGPRGGLATLQQIKRYYLP